MITDYQANLTTLFEMSKSLRKKYNAVEDWTVREHEIYYSLKKLIIEQTGLTENEIVLIRLCREHNLFKKLNTYLRQLILSESLPS